MFVCHGNICRSPMAEFLMKDFLAKEGDKRFYVASSATSNEETGNPVHPGTVRVLNKLGISCRGKVATKLTAEDYCRYDYFVGMDQNNKRNMLKIFGGDSQNKVSLLLDYTDNPRDVADPWYTGNFDATYRDISLGISRFYQYLNDKKN